MKKNSKAKNMKKNSEAQKYSVGWLKNKLTGDQLEDLANYYKGYHKAEILEFDVPSGRGFVQLSDGPLKGTAVFVRGFAFGGDIITDQNTDFEPTDGLPVLVKLYIDWDRIVVTDMKQDVSMKKNPEAQKHSVGWLKNKLTEDQFDQLANYYKGYHKAKIRWFDVKSGEGFVRLSDGPLKDFSVFVHGSAFGGDHNFGQNTDFEPTKDMPVLVKLFMDWDNLLISSMKQDVGMKKNPIKKTLKFKYGSETKIPQKIIDAAPRMGRFDDYGSEILKEYNIQVSLEDSKKYLKDLGAWSAEELNNLEDNKLRLIWVAILDCKENKTNIWYMGI